MASFISQTKKKSINSRHIKTVIPEIQFPNLQVSLAPVKSVESERKSAVLMFNVAEINESIM